ncbi:MAG: leucine-rich repeat protein [Clostridia bacterium]|nr:leucine-rich repeat protein [Clostridia bacterium]
MKKRSLLITLLSLILTFSVSIGLTTSIAYAEETPVEYSMGDANLDGNVNTRDVVLIKQSIVGLTELNDKQKVFADVYADGQINTRDVVLIQQSIVGMGVDLGAHEHSFENGVCICGYVEPHTHNYTELKKSSTQHWYECSCGAYETKENHIPGAEATETTDQKCTECDYVITSAFGHVHTLHLTIVDAKPQSCTEEGNIEYYTCSCGKWFTNNTATTEITDKSSVVIEKYAHEYETLKKTTTEHWWECSCGDKDGLEEHHGGEATCTQKAVCTDCGLEYGSLEKHNYTELKKSSTQHWYECSCGAYETKENHKGGTATCKEKAKCSACGQEYGKLADHTYSTIWTTTETHHYHEATCGHDATKDYSEHTPDNYGFCAICELPMSATEGLIIDASLDGTYAEVVAYGGSSPNVNIPSTYKSLPVKNIYDGAFRSTNVKKVIIPNSITSIGYEAFAYCESLTSVVIGKGVTSIGENAFYGCVSLTSIDIPDSVTSIGTVAFYACSSLASVTMGEGVTSIGNGAFGACDLLYMEENFIIYIKANNNPYYIVGYASNGNLPTYTINSNTKHIGGGAFSSCERLINVSIPDSVTSIGPDAFYSCSLLTSIEIPDGVISIGKNTFYECSSLTNISIPNSVTSIGSYAFYGCSILGKVYYGGTAEEWAKVSIGAPYTNPPLTNATFYYYIENENDLPADNGNYWHYVDGIPTVWAKPEE